jgi:hypothetical protein
MPGFPSRNVSGVMPLSAVCIGAVGCVSLVLLDVTCVQQCLAIGLWRTNGTVSAGGRYGLMFWIWFTGDPSCADWFALAPLLRAWLTLLLRHPSPFKSATSIAQDDRRRTVRLVSLARHP